MRISERKRQIRELASTNPDALAERQVLRAAAESRPVARKPAREARATGRTAAKSSSGAPARPTGRIRAQRGAGFYTWIGVFGLVFAVFLSVSTITSYNSENDQYPKKLATYHAAATAYPTQLAKYNAYTTQLTKYQQAVTKHVKPVPVKPKAVSKPTAPTAPTKPSLNAGSLALPLLYALLSIAYMYLGYRARRNKAAGVAPAPARGRSRGA